MMHICPIPPPLLVQLSCWVRWPGGTVSLLQGFAARHEWLGYSAPFVVAKAAALFCKEGGIRDWTPHEMEYDRELGQICTRYRSGVTPSLTMAYGVSFTRGRGAVGR